MMKLLIILLILIGPVIAGAQPKKLLSVPRISSVEFPGIDSKTTLKKMIPLKEGAPYEAFKLKETIALLQKHFGKQGYLNATVKPKIQRINTKRIKLIFNIKKGRYCLIENIFIKSKNKKLIENLQKTITFYLKRPMSSKNLKNLKDELRLYLLNKNYFSSSVVEIKAQYNASREKVSLYYGITRPIKYAVSIVGTKYYQSGALLNQLDFQRKLSDSSNLIQQAKQQILNKYIDIGFNFVKIRVKATKTGSFRQNIVFYVEEGDRVRIRKFVVSGNISKDPDYYSDFILNNSSKSIYHYYFVKRDLERGYKNLISHLMNQGFLKAKIQSIRYRNNYSKNKVTVFITLNEGEETRVSNIQFVGNKNVPRKDLLKKISLKINSPVLFENVQKTISQIEDHYHSLGYLDAKVTNTSPKDLLFYSQDFTKTAIRYKIKEGHLSKVIDIRIIGNQRTRKEVILRSLTFSKGEFLTSQKIETATFVLYQTTLFSSIEIILKKPDKKTRNKLTKRTPHDKIAVIRVTEKIPGQFKLGLGINNQYGFSVRGYGQISYSNIQGAGRSISARLVGAVATQRTKTPLGRLTLGFLEPSLFGTNFNGRINSTASRNIYGISNEGIKFTASQKTSFLIEKQWGRYLKLVGSLWSVDFNQFYLQSDGERSTAADIRIGSTGLNIEWDQRDNSFVPTKGYFLKGSAYYATEALGSSDNIGFTRVEGDSRIYTSFLNKKWVWANSVRGGHIQNLLNHPDSGIPITQSFFLGGATSLRGFKQTEELERIPNDNILPIDPEQPEQLIKTNHISYSLFKSELRFPISGLFRGAIFYDVGGVFIDGFKPQKNFRHGAGAGLRITTPLGPLALDLAWKLDPQTYPDGRREEPMAFYFSIGSF